MATEGTSLSFDADGSGTDEREESWSLFVAGDASDRGDPSAFDVADPVTERIDAVDLSLVNLEAPVDPGVAPAPKSGPTLESSREFPSFLSTAGFDAATLANNHLMDYGADGLAATLGACREADLDTCGAGSSHEVALAPLERTVAGTDVAVLDVCEREFGVATQSEAGVAWQNHPTVDDRIRATVDDADVVVVVAHGGIEDVPFPPPERQARFREFVDLGVDAVVGHHPHVAQGWEVYRDSPIFYSLGNFLFEQSNPSSQWGLTVDLRFEGTMAVGAELVPVELLDGDLHRLGAERSREDRLAHLHRVAKLTADRERLHAYWQEVAERVFLARLGDALRGSTGGTLRSFLSDPARHLRTHGHWDERRHHDEMLVLLNLTRNESLRTVIETALELRTGTAEDRRTPSVRAEARELIERTTDEPMYDRPHRARVLLEALASKCRREGRDVARSIRSRFSTIS